MKNIHVLKTEKPSRLWINNLLQGKLELSEEVLIGSNTSQHIYITNSEEIKDGEYGICLNLVREGFKSHQAVFKMDSEQRQAMEELGGQKKAEVLKVILTTDIDLIKDGVQAIDDEFLEWFVKNPSCEEVEVNKLCYGALSGFADAGYKIIIPKEEAKKIFDLPIATNLGNALTETMKSVSQHEGGIKQGEINLPSFKQEVIKTEEDAKIFVETMENIPEPNDKLKKAFRDFNKQETLEEAKKYAELSYYGDEVDAFVRGAKWQAERMYSDEEVKDIFRKYRINFSIHRNIQISAKEFDEWFEQFKKK